MYQFREPLPGVGCIHPRLYRAKEFRMGLDDAFLPSGRHTIVRPLLGKLDERRHEILDHHSAIVAEALTHTRSSSPRTRDTSTQPTDRARPMHVISHAADSVRLSAVVTMRDESVKLQSRGRSLALAACARSARYAASRRGQRLTHGHADVRTFT